MSTTRKVFCLNTFLLIMSWVVYKSYFPHRCEFFHPCVHYWSNNTGSTCGGFVCSTYKTCLKKLLTSLLYSLLRPLLLLEYLHKTYLIIWKSINWSSVTFLDNYSYFIPFLLKDDKTHLKRCLHLHMYWLKRVTKRRRCNIIWYKEKCIWFQNMLSTHF